jgi:hypothetical protein
VTSPTTSGPLEPALRVARETAVELRPDVVVPVPRDPAGLTTHEVRLVDGRFMHAECTCGWRTAGRRSRSTVRAEGRDHALLHAGAEPGA